MVTSIFVWSWPIQRSWLQGRARMWVWYACLVLGLAALGALWQLHQSIRARSGDLSAQLTQARARVEPTSTAAIQAEKDFAQSLGSPLQAAPVTQELQRACSASGVVLASVQADFHGAVSVSTQAVLWLSRALSDHLPLVVIGFAAMAALVALAWRRGWMTLAAVASIEQVKPLRQQWDHFRLAKLYQSLALMFKGGYTVDEALHVCQGLALGPRMAQGLTVARREIARGKSASKALAGANLTEAVTERLLAVGERTGSFEAVLQTIADRHAQAFATFVERATRIVEPLLLLLVALVVGGIVVMMYMPIFDIAGGIGGAR